MKAIRICQGDTEEQVVARHKRIQERLDHYGPNLVRGMIGHGFPTEWEPIITAWLKGDKVA